MPLVSLRTSMPCGIGPADVPSGVEPAVPSVPAEPAFPVALSPCSMALTGLLGIDGYVNPSAVCVKVNVPLRVTDPPSNALGNSGNGAADLTASRAALSSDSSPELDAILLLAIVPSFERMNSTVEFPELSMGAQASAGMEPYHFPRTCESILAR